MGESKRQTIDVEVHRRILNFVNAASRAEDLMIAPRHEIRLVDELVMYGDEALHRDEVPHDHDDHEKPTARLFDRELAKRILHARDEYNPVHGFRNISQLERIAGIDRKIIDRLIWVFGPRFRGKWELLYDAD